VVRVARGLRAWGADLVHTHGHFAGVAGRLAARLLGHPTLIHHLHTTDPTLRRRHIRLERLLGRGTHRIVCCSAAVAEHAARVLQVPAARLEVVWNGIEPAPIVEPAAACRRLGDPPRPLVGCVGSLTPHKGQAVLLRAFASLPAPLRRGTLALFGEGEERRSLEALAAELGLAGSVLLPGARADVRGLLPGLDLLVAPSIDREGLGVAVLEGMDAGLPVVASRVGGLPEAIEEGVTGLLVPAGDVAALRDAMAVILEDPTRGKALGDAGRARVAAHFRAAEMIRRVESIYEAALEETRHAA
jgi:glycosyltransferase involved in cell wall biosynthesis